MKAAEKIPAGELHVTLAFCAKKPRKTLEFQMGLYWNHYTFNKMFTFFPRDCAVFFALFLLICNCC